MDDETPPERRSGVLRSKRDATKYQILVEIAERQPAVSQQEIADTIGVTSQAVSNYLQELVEEDAVNKLGRGRYKVTKEGVDWLISETDALEAFATHVSEEVIGPADIGSALASGDIAEGDRVSLTMRDGYSYATPGSAGDATGVAVTSAKAGQDVGVTDFEGVVDHELGAVTVMSVPLVQDGGSQEVDNAVVSEQAADHDRLATAGPEAVATVRDVDLSPDIQFGTAEAVREAAVKGLDVFLVVVANQLSVHTDKLRDSNIAYEVIDGASHEM
ncbi:MarR family transcriptional regulator [Halovenus rubra]|uniref:MarR family transcriptional regulator n=2 Tax=Halovenus rubra TaxID=869890 RepID=A0ABD5XAA5_9EURY|nr:MarR family transcriptional regulator [Halovenus rubra]